MVFGQKAKVDSWKKSATYNRYIYTKPGEQDDPQSRATPLQVGRAMYLEGNFVQAREFYLKLVGENEAATVEGWRGSIYCILAQGQYFEALQEAEKFAQAMPGSRQAASTWLYALAHTLKGAEAEQLTDKVRRLYLERSQAQDSQDFCWLLESIFAFYRIGDITQALDSTSMWKSLFGQDIDKCQFFAEMLFDLGKGDKAFPFLQVGVQKGIDRARMWYLHALSAALNGNFDIAESSDQKLARLHIDLPFAKKLPQEIEKLYAQSHGNGLKKALRFLMPWMR